MKTSRLLLIVTIAFIWGAALTWSVVIAQEPTPTPNPYILPTLPPLPDETPQGTVLDTAAVQPSPTPTVVLGDHYVMERPIYRDATNGRSDWVDRTYPYGGTQYGEREVHHGVEFANPRFTPVLAVADGRVVFAGEDDQTLLGPTFDFYGNVVILEHHRLLSPEGLPVYTLYGHLQEIGVEVGDIVHAGNPIGKVGDSGIAIGPHLHFEVRVGDPFDYSATRNPDLWLKPWRGFGTLAGFVSDIEGNPVYGIVITVQSERVWRETYTYGDDSVNSDPAWGENFTLGDLPADDYDVFIRDEDGQLLFRELVPVESGQTTFIEIQLPINTEEE
ncbi:MAG: hypothetical protein D6712_14900 [Chloroflexi bacterium]|nr:MAG: hypothetical protein D6712_14900 [Chloroflexota bacterium]